MTTPDRVVISVLSSSHLMGPREARRIELANLIAAAPDSDLLVLPYLASCPPFWTKIDRAGGFVYGERVPFPTVGAIAQAVIDRRIPTLASVFEVVAEGVFFATAILIERDGSSRSIYRQQHAVNEPGWHERLYFQAGDNVDVPVIHVQGLPVGLMLGGDVWVPEVARLLRLAGAQTLLEVGGMPESLFGDARILARARSIENGVPVIWCGGSQLGVEGACRESKLPSQSGTWNEIELDSVSIRSMLNRSDPLSLRRPKLYSALSRIWQEPNP